MNIPFAISCLQGDPVTWSNNIDGKAATIFPVCQSLLADGPWGNMIFQYIDRKKFSIWHSHYDIAKRRSFRALADIPLLEFTLQLANNSAYDISHFGHQVVKSAQFNIFYLPAMENTVQFDSGQQMTTLDIHCTFQFLNELSNHFPDILEPLLEQAQINKAFRIFDKPIYATGFMLQLARNILQLLKYPSLNDFLLELNIQSLLCYALACKYELNTKVKRITIEQISRIHTIKHRLETNFNQLPNLTDLAREAHLSLPLFKLYFRDEVNVSPYHYWNENRLNAARNRLMTTNDTIATIAFDFSYANVGEFSRAFKKHFGLTPSEMRGNS